MNNEKEMMEVQELIEAIHETQNYIIAYSLGIYKALKSNAQLCLPNKFIRILRHSLEHQRELLWDLRNQWREATIKNTPQWDNLDEFYPTIEFANDYCCTLVYGLEFVLEENEEFRVENPRDVFIETFDSICSYAVAQTREINRYQNLLLNS